MVIGFINGNIYISFKPIRRVEAFAIANGRIIFTGRNNDVENIVKASGGTIIDLNRKTILPGFIDSHVHIDELGLSLNTIDLRNTRSLKQLKERLREAVNKINTLWILGHGWDQELFEEKIWPTRWDIDEVVKYRPALLTRICLHAAVLNTRAMEITGFLNSTSPNIVRNEEDIPTGIIKEDALEVAWEKIRESMSIEDYEKILDDALRFAVSQGVTTLGFSSCNEKALRALISLWRKNKLCARTRVYLNPGKNWEVIELLKRIGISRGFGDDYLRIMGIKIIVDGSLGARTAWLSEPYADDPSLSGAPDISRDELMTIAKKVHDLGLQLSVHGIGDRAIDMILDVYSELRNIDKYRHRIEHASVLRSDQIERIAKLNIVVSVQPNFIISDWWALNRLGEKRIRWLYPFKTMIINNIALGFGTDSPVEPINPWQTIYAAITRGKYENISHYEYTKHESLNIEDALHIYTYGSAYIMSEEQNLGTLEVGKLADFVIVNKDPLTVDEKDIKNIKVLETYVGGVRVWP